jgi:hypothetical protein
MAKYNSKSVYNVLFSMLEAMSDGNQAYLFNVVFTNKFLSDIENNPIEAYSVLNEIVINIEDGNTDKISRLLRPHSDKLYMMKSMLKDYGDF